ncbi:MAG: 5'-methylthioadenosine phosphorylase, partial [Rhodobacterales bacterium]
GMTNMPEAKLAREAEISYASVAMITDYDSWHPDHGAVEITEILATLDANSAHARALIARLPALLGATHEPCADGCNRALDHAIMTAPDARDPQVVARLDAIAGRVL